MRQTTLRLQMCAKLKRREPLHNLNTKKKKMSKKSFIDYDDKRADQNKIHPESITKRKQRKQKHKQNKLDSLKFDVPDDQIGDYSPISPSYDSPHLDKLHESGFSKKGKVSKKSKMESNKDIELTVASKGFKKQSKNKIQQDQWAESIYQCADKKAGKTHKEGKESAKNLMHTKTESKKRKAFMTADSKIMLPMKKRKNKMFNKPTLDDTGFLWDLKLEDFDKLNETQEEGRDDEDEEDEQLSKSKRKKTKGEKLQEMKDEEARLRLVEQTLLEAENNPKTADQFDRALLAKPDDSDLWIKYIAHHLQATEIDKGRAVARRALQTISQRLEVERLNVWIALLNLENMFGTQESLKTTLDEALRTNDELTVYSKMLNIYTESNKSQETEQLVSVMLRKFRTSPKCWLDCCSALMNINLPDKARNHVQRAISALPNKEHVNLLCKFALMENQHGFSDQSQTLFEHILTSYPKRTDIWNVYVDMLVKSNKIPVARQILERACRQKLPPRNMKMLFSKWVSFEEKHGNAEKVEHVRKQAEAYVGQLTKNLE